MRFKFLVPLPDNRSFNFQPRFYDATKEELKQRQEAIRQEVEGTTSTEEHLKAIRNRMSLAFQRKKRQENTIIWLRILLIMAMFILLLKFFR